jgi:hypothetical protein
MFIPPVTPYSKPLGQGLTLKSVSTLDDVDRLAAFNGHIHSIREDLMTKALIHHHPHSRPEHWLFVEEDTTRRVVSSICLIPWRWCYGGVELRSGEMGVCGTLEEFRNRGLVRALMARHKELLAEGDYHLSHIQGIAYFYRQFGYEYAMPLEGGWRIEPYQINTDLQGYTFRLATADDVPTLIGLHDEAARDLDISARRDADEWTYMLQYTAESETASDFWLALDAAGQPAAYYVVQHYGFGVGLNISEVSRMNHSVAQAALCHMKTLAAERGKPYIRMYVPEKSTLIQTAAAMGASFQGRYAWQIHIPSVPRLLRAIAPVLERRLADSPFAGLTQTVILNLYKETFALRFEGGRLLQAESCGFTDEGEIRIPPLLFAPLVLGWRTRQELADIYPDFNVWGQSRPLVDVLFPKLDSYIYTIY